MKILKEMKKKHNNVDMICTLGYYPLDNRKYDGGKKKESRRKSVEC